MHRHARGQLLGARRGLITVYAGDRQWVAPPSQAVWIPPGWPHGLRSHGPYSGYSVYLSPAACAGLPSAPRALAASALLLAAVERVAAWDGEARDAPRRRVVEVIRDEIRDQPQAAGALLLPRRSPIAAAGAGPVGRSRRHPHAGPMGQLDRHGAAHAGAAFPGGDRPVAERVAAARRLMRALEMLAAGAAVTTVALDLGYDNVSAFIAMFKREHGVTPGRYAPGGA